MATTVDCPSCSRKLSVPDELLGKKVRCPSCSTTFTASESANGLPSSGGALIRREEDDTPRSRRPPPPEDDLEEVPEDDYEEERERRPRRRRKARTYQQPHRGTMIMVLGILALVTGLGLILGPIAWVMGNNDLREMRADRMDREGEGMTNAGRICGMVATILGIVGIVAGLLFCLIYAIFVLFIIGISAGAGGM